MSRRHISKTNRMSPLRLQLTVGMAVACTSATDVDTPPVDSAGGEVDMSEPEDASGSDRVIVE